MTDRWPEYHRAWTLWSDDKTEHGVLVEIGTREDPSHWWVLCPATSTLHIGPATDILGCSDASCLWGDVHREAQQLWRVLNELRPIVRHTWESVSIGHDVPGSGVIVDKQPHVGGFHVVFRRVGPGFAEGEKWATFHLATDRVPIALTSHGLVY